MDPLSTCLTFSILIPFKISLIHWVWEGGIGDSHLNKINRHAKGVVKAITSSLNLVSVKAVGMMPNDAVIGSGSICILHIPVSVLKISIQYVERAGQLQNMCT